MGPHIVVAELDPVNAERTASEVSVNNAGIYRAAKTLDVTEEHWDAVMNINAKARTRIDRAASFNCARVRARSLPAAGSPGRSARARLPFFIPTVG